MERYIKKSALVSELEKRKSQNEEWKNSCKGIDALAASMVIQEDINILSLLDTLEVKEVDLEKEFDSFAYTLPRSAIGDVPFDKHFDDPKIIEARNHGWRHLWSYKEVLKIAKHFFELGINANNPLTFEDIRTIDRILDGIRNENQVFGFPKGFYNEALKRFKVQKGE